MWGRTTEVDKETEIISFSFFVSFLTTVIIHAWSSLYATGAQKMKNNCKVHWNLDTLLTTSPRLPEVTRRSHEDYRKLAKGPTVIILGMMLLDKRTWILPQFFKDKSGWSVGRGSGTVTSRPAPWTETSKKQKQVNNMAEKIRSRPHRNKAGLAI